MIISPNLYNNDVTDVLMLGFMLFLGKQSYDINVYVSNDQDYFEKQKCGYYYHSIDSVDNGMFSHIFLDYFA